LVGLRWSGPYFHLNYVVLVAALCLLTSPVALSQETENATMTNTARGTDTTLDGNTPEAVKPGITTKAKRKKQVASEISVTGMVSYGNYRIFGAAPRCNIWTTGVEYDRNSWGHVLKAQIDYVVEILPIVVLSEPASADFWGNPTSPNQQIVHGLGITPFGFRFLWRSNQKVKPFMTGKAGVIAFPKKILSPASSYANFNFQGDFGLQFRMTDRVDLRVEPVVYFHVSNGYFAASNPGFDQLGTKFGISYHLGKQNGL
jgi:hypothetical protein